MKVNFFCPEIVKIQNNNYNFFWCRLKNQPIGLGCEGCSTGQVQIEPSASPDVATEMSY